MRITVDLDEDILQIAKHLAQEREQSLGRVLSDLAYQGFQSASQAAAESKVIPTLPQKANARPVTTQIVKELLETES
jgi:hypothetical protein